MVNLYAVLVARFRLAKPIVFDSYIVPIAFYLWDISHLSLSIFHSLPVLWVCQFLMHFCFRLTLQLLIKLEDNRLIETVGIPVPDDKGSMRLTACVSSQVIFWDDISQFQICISLLLFNVGFFCTENMYNYPYISHQTVFTTYLLVFYFA